MSKKHRLFLLSSAAAVQNITQQHESWFVRPRSRGRTGAERGRVGVSDAEERAPFLLFKNTESQQTRVASRHLIIVLCQNSEIFTSRAELRWKVENQRWGRRFDCAATTHKIRSLRTSREERVKRKIWSPFSRAWEWIELTCTSMYETTILSSETDNATGEKLFVIIR